MAQSITTPAQPVDQPGTSSGVVLEVGGGGEVHPDYPGAKDYSVDPFGTVALHNFTLFGLGGGSASDQGFSVAPSFDIIDKRKSHKYDDIDGVHDVDATYELGARLAYRFGMFEPFADLRYAFGGAHGLVGEAGVNAIFAPTHRLNVTIGPQLAFATNDYMDEYYGVRGDDSRRSGLRRFNPDGGITGVGANLEARYALTEKWSLIGKVNYTRLVGDAYRSPITKAGSADQVTASLGVTYKFNLGHILGN